MQYLITPLLEVLNPTNTVSRNRLLSFAIGNAEAEIYNCLIAKHVYYNNLGKLTEGGWFYSTVKDLHLSSGYAEDAQKTAVRHLIKHGLIESELKGLPVKRYFSMADDFKFNGKCVAYTEVIDEVNAIVREYGGLYEFIVDFYYEWGRILREEGSSIRNKAAYMKVRIWDWMKRWQIEKESIMAELE